MPLAIFLFILFCAIGCSFPVLVIAAVIDHEEKERRKVGRCHFAE